jgi:predicted MPP superfamily phosphohydrolase
VSIFRLIVFGVPMLAVIWWFWADRRLRCLPRGWRWRLVLAAFVGGNLGMYAWLILTRMSGQAAPIPSVLLAECYIWHLFILPLTVVVLTGATVVRTVVQGGTWIARILRPRPAPAVVAEAGDDPADPPADGQGPVRPTRRQALAGVLTAVPLLATGAAQARSVTQLSTFRIRRLDVPLPTLPPALDGLTIAHVSDSHVGRFTNGAILDEIVARTNALRPDLVVFTGDLIDHTLSDLPAGLDMLRGLEPAERLFACEGNHDLFESRAGFEAGVRRSGVALLVNESAELEIRGERVQMLGLRWGGRGASIDDEVRHLLTLRRPDAFPILLAHHPHAFDPAAAAGVPLTLAGHTHGGQLMLTRDIGAGPLLFRYCSGLYTRGPSSLVVSNGVGNWFPLRINAPAEILHLTLRSAPVAT